MADEIDERVVAGVGHCQPVSAEPEDVDVFVPERKEKLTKVIIWCYRRSLKYLYEIDTHHYYL